MQSISRGCAKTLKNVTKEQGNGKKAVVQWTRIYS